MESIDRMPTKRQLQVLNLMALGLGTKEIARVLGVKPQTILSLRSRAMTVLGARNGINMVYIAIQRGLITVKPIGSD